MKSEIALINPRVTDIPFHPLGILYVASCLEKNGYNVKAYDPLANDRRFLDEIKNTKIVGITMTAAQLNRGLEIAKMIKEHDDSIKIVFGGVHPTAMPKEVLSSKFADFVVIGEGEVTSVELFDKIISGKDDYSKIKGIGYKSGRRLVLTQPRELIQNLDTIPFPARHLLDPDWYFQPPGRIRGMWLDRSTTIMSSRGCPGQCIFCSSYLIFGRNTRYRSPKNVLEEIKELVDDYKIEGLNFIDDTFTVSHKWVREFCTLLKKSKLALTWEAQARVNYVNEEILRIMKSAGCAQVSYGIESGSPNVLKILKKGTTPDQVRNAFKLSRKVGLRALATVMIGNPGEKREDVLMTARLVKDVRPDYTDFFFSTPYPGTELYEMAKCKSWINSSYKKSTWFSDKITDRPVMTINFTEKELIEIRSWLYNQVGLRNYTLYMKNPRQLVKIFSFFLQSFPAFGKALARFAKTKKMDSMLLEMLAYYRKSTKNGH
jgi:anaerobic magnesium-protoporphyrin IX monomethyl ester cyclase